MNKLILVLFILACILTAGCITPASPDPDITPVPAPPAEDPADQNPTPAGSLTVTILSDPPGASILIDGTYIGKTTPETITITAGTHTITAESARGHRTSETHELTNNTTIALSLSQEKNHRQTPHRKRTQQNRLGRSPLIPAVCLHLRKRQTGKQHPLQP